MISKKILVALGLVSCTLLSAKAAPAPEPVAEQKEEAHIDAQKLSIAFGHLIAKNLNEIGVSFDIDSVIQGLKDASNGIPSPLSESDCIQAISQEQKKSFDELAAKNLKEAETFLKQEAKKTGMTSLDQGKVLIKTLQEGKGPALNDQGKIAIRYKGSLLSGEVFGESAQDETIEVNQLVPGLKNALTGMKEGEKRLIYIHPDMGYGTDGLLPPNSLLTFEIELKNAKVIEPASESVSENSSTPLEEESSIR